MSLRPYSPGGVEGGPPADADGLRHLCPAMCGILLDKRDSRATTATGNVLPAARQLSSVLAQFRFVRSHCAKDEGQTRRRILSVARNIERDHK